MARADETAELQDRFVAFEGGKGVPTMDGQAESLQTDSVHLFTSPNLARLTLVCARRRNGHLPSTSKASPIASIVSQPLPLCLAFIETTTVLERSNDDTCVRHPVLSFEKGEPGFPAIPVCESAPLPPRICHDTLNGLDAQPLTEAFETAQNEPGGW